MISGPKLSRDCLCKNIKGLHILPRDAGKVDDTAGSGGPGQGGVHAAGAGEQLPCQQVLKKYQKNILLQIIIG